MSKFEIRSPVTLTAAALALAPALAFAGGDTKRDTTTTTTTTTQSPQGSPTTQSPQGSTAPSPQGSSSTATPPTANGMSASDATQMNRSPSSMQSEIDPAQVQKVFGMDVSLIDLTALNSEQVKVLQQRLSERGFYRGAIDGKVGPGTRNAISGLMAQQFALNQRLINQGQITEQFASGLGVDTRGRMPVSGVDMNDLPSQHPTPRDGTQPAQPSQPVPPEPPNQ